jgi:predicted GNAT family N-acyltransferase
MPDSTFQVCHVPGDGRLADAHAVRRAVFIEEQNVSESEEMDDKDSEADHVVVYDQNGDRPAGTARLRTPEQGVGKAERVAVLPEYRGQGLGTRLMTLLEREASGKGCSCMVLHAQTEVQEFYERLGYTVTSEEFLEAGITHVEMKKPLE